MLIIYFPHRLFVGFDDILCPTHGSYTSFIKTNVTPLRYFNSVINELKMSKLWWPDCLNLRLKIIYIIFKFAIRVKFMKTRTPRRTLFEDDRSSLLVCGYIYSSF